jgi:hypothetical protein
MFRASNGATVNINAKLQIEKGSTATTYEPYSNICPISGWDECNVSVCGKNLFDEPSFKDLSKWKSDLFPYGDFSTDNVNKGFLLNTIPNKTYSISFGFTADTTPNHTYLYLCRAKGNNSERVEYLTSVNYHTNHVTFTTEKGYIYYLRVNVVNASSFVPNMTFAQLELGSTATTYEPYNGTTITIQLGDTYYGGKLDVVSGKLTVDRVSVTYDGSNDESWFVAPQDATAKIIGNATGSKSAITKCLSNLFNSNYSIPWNYDNTIWTRYGQLHVNPDSSIIPSGFTQEGVAEWKTWLSTHNLQAVYELATPQTYQLTPTQVKSLLGTNNVWADTGDIEELEYFSKEA